MSHVMENRPFPWVDSHCHLEMLKGNPNDILNEARQRGMPFCISVGTGVSANRKVVELCDRFDDVYGTLGFHPHYASKFDLVHMEWMQDQIVENQRIVAVGECGFDFYYNRSCREDQQKAFSAQLDLAVESGVPVVIHARDADAATREILEAYRGTDLRGVVHCFTSGIEQARYLLDFGFYLSFNGISTYPQAEEVREVLAYVPNERILLETDSPYLSPVPMRGKPNVPGNVAIVGQYAADFLGVSSESLAQLILENTLTLFQRIPHEH